MILYSKKKSNPTRNLLVFVNILKKVGGIWLKKGKPPLQWG